MKKLLLFLCLASSLLVHSQQWIDATDKYITNPSFDGNSNRGWTISASAGSTSCGYGAQEFWNGTWNIYQTTSVPNGTYRLSVQAYHRRTDNSYSEVANASTNTITSRLYANGESTPLVSVYSEALSSYYNGCYSAYGRYYPNNMESGAYCFEQGMYQNSLEFTVTGGSLTFGIKNTSYLSSNWCMIDNWKLEYWGTLVQATDIRLSDTDLSLELGDTHQLSATLSPSDVTYTKVQWSSSNPDVATVDANGLVTTHSNGSALITATTTDGTALSASCSLTVTYTPPTASQLLINEVMAANVDMFVDPSWNYGGWVEFYNPTPKACNLGLLYVSDDASNLRKSRLSTSLGSLPAGGFATIWFGHEATRKDVGEGWENTQVGFNLPVEGGTIYISDKDGQLITSQQFPPAVMRTSYARTTDGGSLWNYTSTPSPSKSNAGSTFATQQLEAPVVDHDGQLFTSAFTVKVTIPSGAKLRYTTDGTTPTLTNGKTSTTGRFSVSAKTVVYRFRLFADGFLPSNVVTRSYIYKDKDYYLPVVSIVTDPDNLYDDTIGVYVSGTNGKTANQDATKRNFNMEWDRPVSFEFMANGNVEENTDGGYFCQEVDFAINGGWSRKYEPRSFKLKASKVYDLQNSINYPFFTDKPHNKHKSLLFRNGGNDDYNRGRIKDASIQEIARQSEFPLNLQSYQPCHVFIDGSYLGMLNLREPSNKNYGYSNYGYDTDEMDAFEMSVDSGYVQKAGTKEAFMEWYSLAQNASDALVYEQIGKLVDIDDYVNYMAFKFYLNDWDWPHNNAKAFRSRQDGRFHFMVFDLDNCIDRSGNNIFSDFAGKQTHTFYSRPEYGWTSLTKEVELVTIFLGMLQNDDFKRKFIDTYCIVGGNVFGYPDEISSLLSAMQDRVSTALSWEGNSSYLSSQVSAVANALTDDYRTTMTNVLKSYSRFNLSAKEAQAVIVSANVDGAAVSLNGISLPKARFNGYLFAPVTLKATAPAGYRFEGWDDGGVATGETTTSTLFPLGDTWQYYQSGSLDNTSWNALSYSASQSWLQGSAPFGYGNSGKYMATNASTTLAKTDASGNRIPTFYFRKSFTLSDEPQQGDVYTLTYQVDDGMIVYVNGQEVGLYHMWSGATYDQTCQSTGNSNWYEGDEPAVGTITIPYDLLHRGTNVIAVELHNCNSTSSDIWWDATLSATRSVLGEGLYTNSEYTLPASGSVNLQAIFSPLTESELLATNTTPVRINEVSALGNVHVNEYYKREDWIELYNTTSEAVDLAGLYLSDNRRKPQKYQLTSGSIPAHGYAIVWADQMTPVGQLHAPFKLDNADGASVSIQAADGTWADRLEYLAQEDGQTFGRFPDGTSTAYLLSLPSIGKGNFMSSFAPSTVATEDDDITILLALEQGWNWTSHNLSEAVDKSRFTGYAQSIKGQSSEVTNDDLLGWTGTLSALDAARGYKVNMNDAATISLHGALFDTSCPVTLHEGWNWLGVPLLNATSLEAALQNYSPSEGDRVVGFDQFAVYEDGAWTGSLSSLYPGQAYLLKSAQPQDFTWTSLATSKARRRRYAAPKADLSAPWQLNAHAYPNVMNLICQVDLSEDEQPLFLAAFAGDECRGLSPLTSVPELVEGNLSALTSNLSAKTYLTIHGTGGEPLTFRILTADGHELRANETLRLTSNDLVGSSAEPYRLTTLITDQIVSMPTASERPVSVTYYSLGGQRLTHPKGICLQKSTYSDGRTITKKIMN